MPSVTLSIPQQSMYQNVAQGERSPFTSDQDTSQGSDLQKGSSLDFSHLQLNTALLDKELRESIQKALELSSLGQGGWRSASSSSWGSQQMTTDDHGWVDEDEMAAAPAGGRHNAPSDAFARSTFQSANSSMVSQIPPHAPTQPQHATWTHQTQSNSSGETSLDSNLSSHSHPTASFENDSFDLNHFFESAAVPVTLPSSSPFVPHITLPQHPTSPLLLLLWTPTHALTSKWK